MSVVRRLRAMVRRVRGFFRRGALEAEMKTELEAHLDGLTERKIAEGMSPAEARHSAQSEFGGMAQIEERARDTLVVRWLDDSIRDVRFGFRSLWRSPGFTIATIATLALGSAAVAIVGLFFRAVIWSDLPHVPEPAHVVAVMSHRKSNAWNISPVSGPMFLEWKERALSFERMSVYAFASDAVSTREMREFGQGLRVDAEFFSTLGTPAAIGRTFTTDDARSSSPPTVVISDAMWARLFRRSVDAVGSVVQVGATERTVIGVMSPRFEFPHARDYWIPLVWEGTVLSDRSVRFLEVIARLHDGVSTGDASREMGALAASQAQIHPDTDGELSARVIPAWERVTISFRSDVRNFLIAALALQLLVSMNAGGLLFSRLLRRAPLSVMRAALGASRARLMREMLTECMLLAIAGLVAGLVLAFWLRPFAIAAVTPDYPFPRAFAFEFAPAVFALSAVATIATTFAVGLLAAWRCSRLHLAEGVRGGATIIGSKSSGTRLRSSAVVLQVCGTLALLVYCGLRLQEVRALAATDLGVNADGVALFWIRSATPRSPRETASDLDRLLSDLRRMPGVQGAGLSSSMPGQFGARSLPLVIEGQSGDPAKSPRLFVRAISAGTLDTLKIPLLQGRDFNDRDIAGNESVVLIDRLTADRLFPGENPLGRRIATTATPAASDWATIVGIVGPTQPFPQLGGPQPTVYVNWCATPTSESPWVFVRASQHPGDTLRAATKVVGRLDPEAVVVAPTQGSYARQIAASYWNFEWRAHALAAFASIAHVVAAVGIFGLVAYTVTERRREIGIRQALGATRGAVVRQTIWRGFRLVAWGCLAGVIVTVVLGRVLPAWDAGVYKTDQHDPTVYGSVTVALLLLGAIACWLPARRAAKVNPTIALRSE